MLRQLRFETLVIDQGKGVFVRKIFFLILLSACGINPSTRAQELAGDWIGQMNGGFKVRIHFERTNSGFSGKLTNPSGNETVLDQITSDGTHLHFAVNQLNLSFDGVWDDQDKAWNGNLTFQQVYPLTLKRAAAEDLAPTIHKRPQEESIISRPAPYVRRDFKSNNFTSYNG